MRKRAKARPRSILAEQVPDASTGTIGRNAWVLSDELDYRSVRYRKEVSANKLKTRGRREDDQEVRRVIVPMKPSNAGGGKDPGWKRPLWGNVMGTTEPSNKTDTVLKRIAWLSANDAQKQYACLMPLPRFRRKGRLFALYPMGDGGRISGQKDCLNFNPSVPFYSRSVTRLNSCCGHGVRRSSYPRCGLVAMIGGDDRWR